LPGIEAAAAAGMLPGVGSEFPSEFELVERQADSDARMLAERRAVTPGYFETLQIPLLVGELCRLDADSQHVMVNRSFADRYLAGRSVMGLELRDALGGFPSRIAGVVGNAREIAADRAAAPTVYYCYSGGVASPWFLVRTSEEPTAVAGAVRARLNEIAPSRAVHDIAPLEELVGDAYAEDRLLMALLIFFAVTALSLACLGVYGTLSYVVNLRTREVGLRVALGAVSGDIIWQFLTKALRIVALACGVGLVLSLALTRFLSGMLYGLSPTDPTTRSAVLLVVAVVAATAALVPAMRASRVDPMRALRED
jgi:putative ABC transport system permease protein